MNPENRAWLGKKKNHLNKSSSHPCSVIDCILAVRKNADRPRRQIVVHIPKGNFSI